MYVSAVVGIFQHQANGFALLEVAIGLQQAHFLQLSLENMCVDSKTTMSLMMLRTLSHMLITLGWYTVQPLLAVICGFSS